MKIWNIVVSRENKYKKYGLELGSLSLFQRESWYWQLSKTIKHGLFCVILGYVLNTLFAKIWNGTTYLVILFQYFDYFSPFQI